MSTRWNAEPTSIVYEWYKTGTSTVIGTGVSYQLKPSDAYGYVSVRMTATRAGYAPFTKEVDLASIIASGTGFKLPPPPTITGSTIVGQTLTANVGIWNPEPTSYTYQWLRNGSVVSGATGKTFTLSASDVGRNISVRVTGTKSGYSSATQTSAETIAVLAIPTFTNSSVPTIAGSAVVGQTLAASITGWSPEPEGVSFLWYVSPSTVPSGWGPSYTIKPSDLGKKITVRAIASRSGLNSLTLTSSPTESVADAAPIESIPEATITTSRESTITSSRLESTTKPSATGNSYFDEYLFEAIYRRIGLQNRLQPFAGG
jgi:hypothetical protein